jgi:hypothetical protein
MGFHAAKAGAAFIATGGVRFGDGLAGAFVDNNGYALGTTMIMPLLLVTAQNIQVLLPEPGLIQTWVRRGLYASVPLCLFAVIGTYSRGGFLSVVAVAFMFLFLQRRRFTALASLVAVVAVLLLVVPIPQAISIASRPSRPTRKWVRIQHSAGHFWKVASRWDCQTRLASACTYEAAYDRYFLHGRFGESRAVHSAHVQVFAELGFFGATIWRGCSMRSSPACGFDRVPVRTSLKATGICCHGRERAPASMVAFVVGGVPGACAQRPHVADVRDGGGSGSALHQDMRTARL